MTLDESIEICSKYLATNDASVLTNDFIKTVRDALLNTKKYAWHNLRESRFDLPSEAARVVFRTVLDDNGDNLWTGYYSELIECFMNDDAEGWMTEATYPIDSAVLAWRYCEPFEE